MAFLQTSCAHLDLAHRHLHDQAYDWIPSCKCAGCRELWRIRSRLPEGLRFGSKVATDLCLRVILVVALRADPEAVLSLIIDVIAQFAVFYWPAADIAVCVRPLPGGVAAHR